MSINQNFFNSFDFGSSRKPRSKIQGFLDVDTCIYLNLWKKEVSLLGEPLWKFAQDFFKKAELNNNLIYYVRKINYILKDVDIVETMSDFSEHPENPKAKYKVFLILDLF